MFDPTSNSLMSPNLHGKNLVYKSIQTGKTVNATDDQTLLMSGTSENLDTKNKYKNIIRYAAFNPTISRKRLENGCSTCGRKVITYQRLGVQETIIHHCICGAIW